ncbi:hypothetical protein G9A89_014507 [Geosiphon pyriformis]|nr:hypothetical protein G9A89_014507 [Geosiphon pyriformis]
MSGSSAKRRSERVLTTGSVGSGSGHNIKKPSGGAKLSNGGATLKGSGSGCVVRQFNSIDTDEEVSKDDGIPGSKINTPQAKHFNNGATVGSFFSSINYDMEEEEKVSLPPHKSFSLNKKSATAKTQTIRKLFSSINGFGGATTPSKFEGIIRSTFTSEISMEKATSLAQKNGIIVNSDLKKQRIHSNWAVVIKEIPMDMSKNMIVTTLSEFGQVKTVVEFAESSQAVQLVSKWFFLIGKDSVCVAMAVGDCDTWAFRDQFKALLFTLLVGTTAYDLGDLLTEAGRKTCNDEILESAFHIEPIFSEMRLSWARLGLVWCKRYRTLGYSVLECDAKILTSSIPSKSFKRAVSDENHLQLARLYTKKSVPIFHPAAFGSKSWAQVVSLASSSNSSHFGFNPGFGSSSSGASGVIGPLSPTVPVGLFLETCLTSLEHSLELLMDKVFGIVNKLDKLNLVPSAFVLSSQPSVVLVTANMEINSNMVLDNPKPVVLSPSSVSSGVLSLVKVDGLRSFDLFGVREIRSDVCWLRFCSLFFISMNSLVWNIAMCNIRGMNVHAKQDNVIMNKFLGVHVFTSDLDISFSGADMAVIMIFSMVWHLLFKGKLSVTVMGLYAGALAVNSLIACAINLSSFVILDGDFNESDTKKSASLRKCLDLGLVNSFKEHSLAKTPMWSNSKGVEKVIDYIFVSKNLVSVLIKRNIGVVLDFFDMDHKMISVSIGLEGFLDAQLNSICKQANRNRWKFDFKDFKDNVSATLSLVISGFLNAKILGDLDGMWDVLSGVIVGAADTTFSRCWFREFNCSKNRHSSRFLGLELLVAKVVRSLNTDDKYRCDFLIKRWFLIDYKEAFKFDFLVQNGANSVEVFKHLSQVRKYYRKSKYHESRVAKNTVIRSAIDKCMENFSFDKGGMIRSILERLFCKVVLDYLVIGDEMVLDPIEVKGRVDNNTFFNVMNVICFSELVNVIVGLPDGKVAGLFGITNKLWKHCSDNMLKCLLSLLNSCLIIDGILTNTRPIALIETARKILSKLLSDHISSACFRRDVLRGNNFSVLKDTFTQSPVFAVVLQNMHKTYNSVGWQQLEASLKQIKMCDRFVSFFGNLYVGRINRVMTDFDLLDEYSVLDSLDQEKVFSSLLWRIFYDLLLCKVKNQEHLYGYRINTNFVAKFGKIESSGSQSSFFAAGAFVDNTIWIGNGQALTQHILDIVSKFFEVNDIAINSEKTVAIPINRRVLNMSLRINRLSIPIAKQGEAYRYLGIFLSTDRLFKFSLAKAQSDVRFFFNTVFRKALTDKQFAYLIFVSKSVCLKWDVMLRKGLKSKANLSCDFPMASVVWFSNAPGILGHLFKHHFLDLQVLGWALLNLLQHPIKLKVNPFNNFLASVVRIFLDNDISLANNLSCAFCGAGLFSVLMILGCSYYFNVVLSLKRFGVAFGDRLLGKDGLFSKVSAYVDGHHLISGGLSAVSGGSDFLGSERYLDVRKHLHEFWSNAFVVYTDSSLSYLGTAEVAGRTVAYFSNAEVGIEVEVNGLFSSTMVELYAIVLVLECEQMLSGEALYLQVD